MRKTFLVIIVLSLVIFASLVTTQNIYAQEKQPFQPGTVTLENGNIVEWGYSGTEKKNLTLFATRQWLGQRPAGKSRLVVTVYDKTGEPIETEYSLTVTEDFPSFGTIVFKNISEKDSSKIGSFSVKIEAV